MPLTRREDWPDRLAAFTYDNRERNFEWGPWDCVSAAIDWVEQMTGVRVRDVTWTNEEEARAALEEAGGLIAAVSGVLSRPSQNFADARRGDIGLVDQPGTVSGIGLMVCTGIHWVGPAIDGLAFRPLREARLVWRVG